MKKGKLFITGILIAAACVILQAGIVMAGSVSATGDKDTAVVGDSYTVSVKVDGADGAAVAPEVSVNYDANRLEFVSCSGEYGGGGGGLVTLNSSEADVTFNILSGGQAEVNVSAIFDGEPEAQTATASVSVEGEDTAAALSAEGENAGTGIEAGSVATPDGKIVSAVFADEFMPIGFYKTTVTYEEQMVEAAQFDMGGIVLLYVTDADGNNGNFDMYDQTTGQLSDFLQISGIENRFIIALSAGPEVTVPTDFTKATLQWNAQTLEAYAYTGAAPEGSSVNISDFFLIYAVSSEGNKGWYMYDQNEGTYQRYVEGLHSGASQASSDSLISQITSPSSDSEDGGINVMLIIVIACAALLLILIITVIIMAVKLHEYNSYDYIDEDEEDGDNYLNRLAASSTNDMPGARAAREAINKDSEKTENEDDTDIKVYNNVKESDADNNESAKEMPKSENIYEKYRREEEDDSKSIPEEFVVRKKAARIQEEELEEQESYERDIDEDEESDMFSPRDRKRGFSEDGEKLSRADKKALKAEEKARKKEEKRLRKEYGEYGPVDWQSWQDGVEGGERTAAAHMNRGVDDEPVARRRPEELREAKYEEEPIRVSRVEREEMPARPEKPKRAPQPEYEEYQPPKDNPMDMMRSIPANDNKAPVQAKPVQQFDFDDDFEFEFLDLDEDDD